MKQFFSSLRLSAVDGFRLLLAAGIWRLGEIALDDIDDWFWRLAGEILLLVVAVAFAYVLWAIFAARPEFRVEWFTSEGQSLESESLPLQFSGSRPSRFFELRLIHSYGPLHIGEVARVYAAGASVLLKLVPEGAALLTVDRAGVGDTSNLQDGSGVLFRIGPECSDGVAATTRVEVQPVADHQGLPVAIRVEFGDLNGERRKRPRVRLKTTVSQLVLHHEGSS